MSLIPATQLSPQAETYLPTGTGVVDQLLGGGLLPGLLTIFQSTTGPKSFRPFLLRLLERHAARHPLLIDTVNQLPILQLAQHRRRHRNGLQMLSQLHVLRAFNYHQIHEALTKYLAPEVQQRSASLVILLGLGEQFLSAEAQQNLQYEDRPPTFALEELMEALGVLKAIVLEHQLYCLILTSRAPRSRTKTIGGTFLAHCGGVIVQQAPDHDGVRWRLLAHPVRAPQENYQGYGRNGSQFLDNFLPKQSSFQEWVQYLARQSKQHNPQQLDAYLQSL